MDGMFTRLHRLKVDATGRVLLPAELRHRHHIHQGDVVLVEEDEDGGIHLRTGERILQEVQDYFSQFASGDDLVSEDLIRDRREEALRE